MYLSRDGAVTWEEIKSPLSVKVAPPRRTPQGTLLLTGGVFSKPELQASKDGGKTWTKVSDSIELAEQIVRPPTQGLLVVDSGARFGSSPESATRPTKARRGASSTRTSIAPRTRRSRRRNSFRTCPRESRGAVAYPLLGNLRKTLEAARSDR
jgi:hypothetical protein